MAKALIIGASGGIGRALAGQAQVQGYKIDTLSRSCDGFELSDEASVDRHMSQLDGPYDLIIVATGALEIKGAKPEKSLRSVSGASMAAQFAVNAIGPALVLRHVPRLLPRDRRAVFAALSARVGSIGDNRLGGWYSYRASKAALNQILRSASIEIARTHPKAVILGLHPGTVATSFTERYVAKENATHAERAAEQLMHVINQTEETGLFLDYAGRPIPW